MPHLLKTVLIVAAVLVVDRATGVTLKVAKMINPNAA